MKKIFKYSLGKIFWMLFLTVLCVCIYDIIQYFFPFSDPKFSSGTWKNPEDWDWMILPMLFFSAFFEEIIFRVIPLTIAHYIKEYTNYKTIWIPIAILSSLIFGYLHGSFGNILFQGVSGFFLSFIWVKVSEDKEINKLKIYWIMPTIVTGLIHFGFNLTLVSSLYIKEYVINLIHRI